MYIVSFVRVSVYVCAWCSVMYMRWFIDILVKIGTGTRIHKTLDFDTTVSFVCKTRF